MGRYANADLYKGDYILESKLSDTPMLKNAYLSKLNGENLAISVSIKSFAAGLSGKLEAGDIVTLIASDVGERRETLVLPELKYVEIIAATVSSDQHWRPSPPRPPACRPRFRADCNRRFPPLSASSP
mgnify:CR=1 FL=1